MSTTDDDHEGLDVVDVGDSFLDEDIKLEYATAGLKRGHTTTTGARYLCPYGCGKLVAVRTIDYHKNNGCGRRLNEITLTAPDVKKRYYSCGVCYTEFVTRVEFHSHLQVEHDVHPETHHLSFKDRSTFDRFLKWLEMEGGAHFRHKSGSKRRGRGKGIFLACNRSGFVSSGSATDPSRERIGPFRLGFSCTAFVHGTEHDDGHVTAEVCGDHYGHDARLRLPNVIKQIIAQKQIEGESATNILAYLRGHFSQLSTQNIFAQRICYVDQDELKNIYLCNTKKWESRGIPTICEIWEEELLDRAGIDRALPRIRDFNEKTTQEIAIEENWPRPRVFTVKVRADNGVLVPLEEARNVGLIQSQLFSHGESGTRYDDLDEMEFDDSHYEPIEEEIVETTEMAYVKTEDGKLLGDGAAIEVVREEQVVTESGPQHRSTLRRQSGNEGDVQVTLNDVSPNLKQRSALKYYQVQESQATDEPPFAQSWNEQVLEELDDIKNIVTKRGSQISNANLRAAVIRLRSINSSLVSDKNTENTRVVFAQEVRNNYRPGKTLSADPTELRRSYGRGDVTLLPIEDEMSDDEPIIGASKEITFNANFWS